MAQKINDLKSMYIVKLRFLIFGTLGQSWALPVFFSFFTN